MVNLYASKTVNGTNYTTKRQYLNIHNKNYYLFRAEVSGCGNTGWNAFSHNGGISDLQNCKHFVNLHSALDNLFKK